MGNDDINVLKTDIALIQKDVKQIERIFKKVDDAVGQMSDILKVTAVQENILENNDRRIGNLEESLRAHNEHEAAFRIDFNRKFEEMKDSEQKERQLRHRELLESIEKLNTKMIEKFDKQDTRIRALENWRWYLLGISAVIIFIVNKLPWQSLF